MLFMLFLLLFLLGAIATFEIPILLKQNSRRSLIAFIVGMTLVALMASLQVLRVSLPNPTHFITYLVTKGFEIFRGVV